jgi:hypothetical protein
MGGKDRGHEPGARARQLVAFVAVPQVPPMAASAP